MRAHRVAVILLVCAAALVTCVASASAYTGIASFDADISDTQAGGHPEVHVAWDLANRQLEFGHFPQEGESVPFPVDGCHCEDPRDITVHFPAGFIGDPHAVPRCSLSTFALKECPPEAQIGVVFLKIGGGSGTAEGVASPIYNLVPHPDEAGLIGLVAPIINIQLLSSLSARTGSDYGLDATAVGIFHFFPVAFLDLYIWGVPASPIHDNARFPLPHTGPQEFCSGTPTNQVGSGGPPEFFGCHVPTPSSAPELPFLESPTRCGVPLSAVLDVTYTTNVFVQASAAWPATTGCDQLSFSPSLTAKPTTTQAETGSGIDIELKVPQTQSPSVPSPSEIQAATITLPAGFSVNANAADGKTGCTDAEANFGSEDAAQCPEFAKVGTVNLESSALPGPIGGAIYLGSPLPGDRYRIFFTADGYATHVKLKGSAHLDPQTGQIVATFTDLPQAPFQVFSVHFFGSERGIFVTPSDCGTYHLTSEFVPWDEALPNQTSKASFTIDSGPNGSPCPDPSQHPFSPRLQAGTPDNTAGAFSPFVLKVDRSDGDQSLSAVTVHTPPGFAAVLKSIPYCSEAAIAATAESGYAGLAELASPRCPGASQIGTATVGVGAGTHQVFFGSRVYLAGPYKGAPLSFAIVTPAVSGPYDLGNVVARVAIEVDPVTARVTAVSDPLPQIIEGIPLRLRSIVFDANRPNFTLNPTNCDPFSVDGAIFGNQGAVATPSVHFQIANCADLPYGPKLSFKLTGGTKRRGHPAIHAILRTAPGEANTRSVSVTLPKGELLDNDHIGTICTRPAFAKGTCPAGSLVGHAKATTPLLGNPLEGSVYLRASSNELPDLVADLHGQLNLELSGRIDTAGGGLRTTFDSVPDAPVESFVLDLLGGSKGLVINSKSLCGSPSKARVQMTGQNGVVTKAKAPLQAACSSKARHKRQNRGSR